jgi:hypothetical protein
MVRAVDNRVASTKESLSMSKPVWPDDEGAEPEPQGCLAAVLKLFGIRLHSADEPPVTDGLPYRLSQRFLSPAELSFYKVLAQVVPADTVVAVKPRLGDILFVPRGTSGRWAFQNKIQSKHVDFLVCDARTMTPRLAIELDDKSHERADRNGTRRIRGPGFRCRWNSSPAFQSSKWLRARRHSRAGPFRVRNASPNSGRALPGKQSSELSELPHSDDSTHRIKRPAERQFFLGMRKLSQLPNDDSVRLIVIAVGRESAHQGYGSDSACTAQSACFVVICSQN